MTTEQAVRTVEEVVPLARRGGHPGVRRAVRHLRLPVRGGGAAGSGSWSSPSDWRRRASTSSRSPTPSASPFPPTYAPGAPPSARSPATIPLRAHFHNTRNTGYANALAAYEAGVTVLDASLGGIGGCPFAPRATGNIATEDLVYALERSGVDTGCDLDALIGASEWLGEHLGRPTPSLVSKAGGFPAASS